jgi:hypothetical protein
MQKNIHKNQSINPPEPLTANLPDPHFICLWGDKKMFRIDADILHSSISENRSKT